MVFVGVGAVATPTVDDPRRWVPSLKSSPFVYWNFNSETTTLTPLSCSKVPPATGRVDQNVWYAGASFRAKVWIFGVVPVTVSESVPKCAARMRPLESGWLANSASPSNHAFVLYSPGRNACPSMSDRGAV